MSTYDMILPNLSLQFLVVFKIQYSIWMNIENKIIAQNNIHCTPWHRTSDQNIEENHISFQMMCQCVQFCINVKQMFHFDMFVQKT